MKKLIALLLTLTMLIGIAAVPAAAEGKGKILYLSNLNSGAQYEFYVAYLNMMAEQLGYTGAASDSTGTGFEMNVMVSLILGGMPLKGGMKSRLSCAIIGSLTYSLLAVGLPIIGVPTRLTFLIKAAIFLIVVLITCREKNGVLPR